LELEIDVEEGERGRFLELNFVVEIVGLRGDLKLSK